MGLQLPMAKSGLGGLRRLRIARRFPHTAVGFLLFRFYHKPSGKISPAGILPRLTNTEFPASLDTLCVPQPSSGHYSPVEIDSNLIASLFALSAAALFGSGIVFVKLGLKTVDSFNGALISISTSALVFAVTAPIYMERHYWLSPAVLVFAAIGLVRPVLSTNLAFAGANFLGPTLSTTVASTTPIFAVLGGVIFLSESLTGPIVGGTLGVVAGVMVLSWRGQAHRDWPLWALLFPLGAAFIRSFAHVGAKAGLQFLPSPMMAGFCAYSVSVLVALLARRFRTSDPINLRLPGTRWFMLTGLSNAGAIFSLNSGLVAGTVVMVSPVTYTVLV